MSMLDIIEVMVEVGKESKRAKRCAEERRAKARREERAERLLDAIEGHDDSASLRRQLRQYKLRLAEIKLGWSYEELIEAAKSGDSDQVRALIKEGADIHANRMEAAILMKKIRILKEELEVLKEELEG